MSSVNSRLRCSGGSLIWGGGGEFDAFFKCLCVLGVIFLGDLGFFGKIHSGDIWI